MLKQLKFIFCKHTLMSKRKTTNPHQHQDFDNVLKKTFTRVYESLIHKLLGLDLKNMVKLPSTFSRTKEKRPDFSVKVQPIGEKPHIVHVEFQGRSDANMHKRQLAYYNDFYWEFDLEIIQYVIFMGTGKPSMITKIKHKNLDFSYKMIVLNEIDANLFLNSDNPHELILAILCHYEKRDAPKIIQKILKKLQQKAKNDNELHEYTTDLEILSGLRKLQSETKKQIDKMPIAYDLTKDLRFIEGKQEGKQEGRQEGEHVGEQKKARAAVINLLKDKVLSVEQIARVLEVSLDFVKNIQEELKNNPKLK